MNNKAVFMDRDKTLIEDPGYLNDPNAVKLLPGVELDHPVAAETTRE